MTREKCKRIITTVFAALITIMLLLTLCLTYFREKDYIGVTAALKSNGFDLVGIKVVVKIEKTEIVSRNILDSVNDMELTTNHKAQLKGMVVGGIVTSYVILVTSAVFLFYIAWKNTKMSQNNDVNVNAVFAISFGLSLLYMILALCTCKFVTKYVDGGTLQAKSNSYISIIILAVLFALDKYAEYAISRNPKLVDAPKPGASKTNEAVKEIAKPVTAEKVNDGTDIEVLKLCKEKKEKGILSESEYGVIKKRILSASISWNRPVLIDIKEKLNTTEKYYELLKNEVITEEEYEIKKGNLLKIV